MLCIYGSSRSSPMRKTAAFSAHLPNFKQIAFTMHIPDYYIISSLHVLINSYMSNYMCLRS